MCSRIEPQKTLPPPAQWLAAQVGQIDLYPWADADASYLPRVEFRLLHDGQALYVRFDIWEKNIRATYTTPNDPVCRDSCAEFFFRPDPEDHRYLSFEINPLGTLLIGLSTSGHDLRFLTEDRGIFFIKTCLEKEYWQVTYKIPFPFIRSYFSNVGPRMLGNFMKCADRSVTPHHGCWNRIETDVAMFHMPQFFGEIELLDTIREI